MNMPIQTLRLKYKLSSFLGQSSTQHDNLAPQLSHYWLQISIIRLADRLYGPTPVCSVHSCVTMTAFSCLLIGLSRMSIIWEWDWPQDTCKRRQGKMLVIQTFRVWPAAWFFAFLSVDEALSRGFLNLLFRGRFMRLKKVNCLDCNVIRNLVSSCK